MKTQLLQDIDESGSKSGPQPPPTLPAARPDEGASLIERAAQAPRAAAPAPAVVPTSAAISVPDAAPDRAPELAAELAPGLEAAPAAASSPAPAPRPPAAVWRRAQATPAAQALHEGIAGASMQRAFDPRYGEARVPPPRHAVPEPSFAPRDAAPPIPPAPPVPPVPPVPPIPPARDPAPESAIPDWLNERLREDAQREERVQWSSAWKRRLATWSMAGGLLAVVAAGALWVYEDNRVDGALGVVAQTSPGQKPAPSALVLTPAPVEAPPTVQAPAPAPAPVVAAQAAPEPPQAAAPTPSTSTAPTEAALPAIAGGAGALAPAAGGAKREADPPAAPPATREAETKAAQQAAARAERRSAAAAARRSAQRRQVAQADKPRRPASAPVTAEPTPRQRREETLMQCRAHGYDQRQCDRRGCLMTSYGFVCKG
ncbi:hypothetical protein [Massilia sp. TN1-12]|uniref:hypothetical protein n=1 Tax=Massilia paldalensis TaxID=3377675 RepID=UPI00384BF9C8